MGDETTSKKSGAWNGGQDRKKTGRFFIRAGIGGLLAVDQGLPSVRRFAFSGAGDGGGRSRGQGGLGVVRLPSMSRDRGGFGRLFSGRLLAIVPGMRLFSLNFDRGHRGKTVPCGGRGGTGRRRGNGFGHWGGGKSFGFACPRRREKPKTCADGPRFGARGNTKTPLRPRPTGRFDRVRAPPPAAKKKKKTG